jgi:hypothetical protein
MSLGTWALGPSRAQAQELQGIDNHDTYAVRWWRDGDGVRWWRGYHAPRYWGGYNGYPAYRYYYPGYDSYYPGYSGYATWPGYSAYYPPPATPYYGTYYYGW